MTTTATQVTDWLSAFLSGEMDFARLEENCANAVAAGRLDAAAFRDALAVGHGGPADRLPPHLRLALLRLAPQGDPAAESAAADDDDATVPRDHREGSARPTPERPSPKIAASATVSAETEPGPGALAPKVSSAPGSLPRLDGVTEEEDVEAAATTEAKVNAASVDDLLGSFKKVGQSRRSGNARGRDPGIDRQLDEMLQGWRSHRDRVQAKRGSGERQSRQPLSPGQTLDRLAVGTMLAGRYVLDAELGRGGSGRVYRAIDRRRLEAGDPQPQLALKALAVNVRQNPNAYRLLAQEVHRTQTLAHPHIIQIRDLDRDGDIAFLTMALLEGRPLDTALSDGPIAWEILSNWLSQVCAALAFAHEEGIVHADIKPGNIFAPRPDARGRQRLRLLDFGIARSVAEAGGAPGAGYTPAYASPAVLDGAAPGFADDIFSLGVTAAELASGVHPFGGGTVAAPQSAPPGAPDVVPPAAWAAIEAAMATDPAKRPDSIAAFVEKLGLVG